MNVIQDTVIRPEDSIRFATELRKTRIVHDNSILRELLEALIAPWMEWEKTAPMPILTPDQELRAQALNQKLLREDELPDENQ